MRYALRNQTKIKESLGDDLLLRILESLKQAFILWGDNITEIVEGQPYPILTIGDAGHTCNLVAFYVISKKYDVYKLAFKEFVG